MRPLRHASPLARLIATLGILAILQGAATIRYGGNLIEVPSSLPQQVMHWGGIAFSEDRLYLFGIAAALTVSLWAVTRFTTLGLVSSAVAENQRAAAALGWSPDVVATATWSLGAVLAAVAGILVVPLSGLQVSNLTLVVVAAMAAALVGGFSSFPVTLAGGMAIGIVQSEMARYVQQPGVSDAFPFLAIMVVLIVRGKTLPVRSHMLERLPGLGTGIVKARVIVPLSLLLAVLMLTVFPQNLTIAINVQLTVAVILLSVVLVTGYTGQLSLAQFALAGIGAYVAGRLVASQGWPLEAALPAGVLGAAAVGILFGIPALRTRGVNLAVVTLGLALTVQEVLFDNSNYTGGTAGTTVGPARFFGVNLDPILYPARYAVFCLVWFVLAAVAVANVRRGRVGRRLVSVRGNERAAASLGVSVTGAKLYSFGLGAAIAGLGGVLLGFQNYAIVYNNFDALSSVNLVGEATIGGIGHVPGSLAGSGFATGGVGSYILDHFASLNEWLGLIGGVTVLLTLLLNPEGVAGAAANLPGRRLIEGLLRRRHGSAMAALPPAARAAGGRAVPAAPAVLPTAKRSASLEVEEVTVSFGGVRALKKVTLAVHAGETVGLIGPNGAGKTTLIDVITGYVRPQHGRVALGGADLSAEPAARRARAGVTRSFQSLELFEDMTVRENLQAASDPRDLSAYLTNLVRPGRRDLPESAAAAVREFGLDAELGAKPQELPYGRRRLVAIARAVATDPAILLLDEPAAGLDDAETAELSTLIRQLVDRRGIGILLVEHDMNLVMGVCDRIVVLNFGEILASGTPEEVRAHPEVIAAYLGRGVAEPGPDASSGDQPAPTPMDRV
jgi:ABC-type branched-subunit amino acid transport system ATPase component/ABC-type branched-subunit amino acid transport system permease subunit